MNVSIEPDLAKFIEDEVRARRYDSADAAVNAAVLRLKAEHELLAEEIDDDDVAAIEEGLAQLQRGEGRPWEQVRAEFKARHVHALSAPHSGQRPGLARRS
jgi:Arc/MetJ-type ribon-helix-helix transcriptional regulator